MVLGKIIKLLNGKIVGDPDVEINSLAKIEEGKKGDLSCRPVQRTALLQWAYKYDI